MWNCTHFRHPTDEQLGHVDIFFSNYYNLQSVYFEFELICKQQVSYPALLNVKSVGFHILLLSVTIRYCHSFRCYKVQSWKTVYISRRCQIAEKDNNCVNFWYRKSLGKLNHVPTSNKTDSFSILIYFISNLNFLMKEIVPKRDL